MNDLPKNWWASKTIWASILATVWPLALLLSKQFNFDLPNADSVAGALGDIGTVVLSAIAIYGRITASAPIATPPAKPPALNTLGPIAFLVVALALSACTSQQLATAQAEQQKIQAAINSNAAAIDAFCTGKVLPIANSTAADLLAMAFGPVAQAQRSAVAACAAVDKVAQSASTLTWLIDQTTIMESKGAVLPAPVAPKPVS